MSEPTSAAPFVAQLRSRPGIIRLAGPDDVAISIRVQGAEAWDTLRFEMAPDQPVLAVKQEALRVLQPDAVHHEDYVIKLNGFEVLDEEVPVVETGARNGSTFLLAHRRRQPVR